VRLTDPLRSELSVQRRLEPDQVAELVTAYQQGTTVKELAARYRINRTTVLGHLRRQGVPKRHPEPVADVDADRAVRLYGAGASIGAVAQELRVAPTTVRRVLRKAGVEVRPRGRTRRLDQRSR
jgi:transposase-like protein